MARAAVTATTRTGKAVSDNGLLPMRTVTAIEREAAQQERERIREAIDEELGGPDSWAGSESPDFFESGSRAAYNYILSILAEPSDD